MSGRNTATRDKHRAVILKASTICWLCGHDGADAVDHKIPLDSAKDDAERRHLDQLWNKAPAHHDVKCPTCGHKCNREKSNKLVAPVMPRSTALAR